MLRIRNFLISLSVSLTLLLGLLSYVPVAALDCNNPANAKEAAQCGVCGAAGLPACDNGTKAANTLSDTITNIVNILSIVIGIVAVVMIMLAGLRYITSAGNAEKVASAKNALLYAVVGLVIVVLAQAIVRFVLTEI